MSETERRPHLTPLQEKIVDATSDGIPRTNLQIANLTGTTGDSVKSTRSYMKRDAGIIIPVKKQLTPIQDGIVYHVWKGARTREKLAELLHTSKNAVSISLLRLREVHKIEVPVEGTKYWREKNRVSITGSIDLNAHLTSLEKKIIGLFFEDITRTNSQIAELTESTEDSVAVTRSVLKSDKGIKVPARKDSPLMDAIVYYVFFEGAETLEELAEIIGTSEASIKTTLYHLWKKRKIRINLAEIRAARRELEKLDNPTNKTTL